MTTTGTGKRRSRSKIARLSADLRGVVAARLLDGATYADIRRELAALGVGEDEMPGDSSFKSYRESDEYGRLRDDRLGWLRRAAEKKAVMAALEKGGADAVADYAVATAVQELSEAMADAEGADLTQIANSIAALKRVMIQGAREQYRQRAAERQAALERAAAEAGKGEVPFEDIAKALKEIFA